MEINHSPELKRRIAAVKEKRLASTKAAPRKKAETPWLFDELRDTGETYISIPKVSSERRKYIPIGFVENDMTPGDKLYFIPTDSLYSFCVLMSQFHNAWMGVVGGRKGISYSYANTIFYNNYIWPTPSEKEKEAIENATQAVLDALAAYPEATLEDLYEVDNAAKYPELTAAHAQLDKAVEVAYHVDIGGAEKAIVAHLFNLYVETVKKQEKAKNRTTNKKN